MTPATETFGSRLHAAVADRGPFCVGIDPHATLLREWGLPDDVSGLERFALSAVEAIAPHCSMVKPQSAFYERHGSQGIAVLEQVICRAREAGALVLLDVKRGDIGSTSQAYADAYLDPSSPIAVDAITASPYLGFGSLTPMFETARRHGSGVFVLALTSNPEGAEVQLARRDGIGVAERVLSGVRELNRGADPWGSFGAVVGATIDDAGVDRRRPFDLNGPILAPGCGAQGGTAADVRRIFGPVADQVLPSSSREVLRAGPEAQALRDAVRRANEEWR